VASCWRGARSWLGRVAVGALAFGVALMLGGLMIYCFWLIITTSGLLDRALDEIVELFEGIYQAGRWPVTASTPAGCASG
jgi:ABC-type uncharacterized transport system permease subunit